MMEDIKSQIQSMRIGEFKDITLSNGILKSTKTLIRNSNSEWEIHSFTDGWCTAYLDFNKAVLYCSGKIKWNDLHWE